MEESTIKEELRSAISAFCRWRINQNLCEPNECEFCPVDDTYDMARDTNKDETNFDEVIK